MNARFWAFFIALFWRVASCASPLLLPEISPNHPLGLSASYMLEAGKPLTLSEAVSAEASGKFAPGKSPVLDFGIGSRPVWIHLSILNPSISGLERSILIENSWLDHIRLYFLKDGKVEASFDAGDSMPFRMRPFPGRFFSFDHEFSPGRTEIYLRIVTPDPVVVPIFMLDRQAEASREMLQGYGYGFVYGYLIALMAYNLLLYLKLREKRLLLYAAFLAAFLLTNIAYTGHGFAWIWPNETGLQRWIIPTLMVTFGIAGLAFARHFLETRANFPRLHNAVKGMSFLFAILLAASFLADSQLYALLTAFTFVTFFSVMMPVMGVLSLHSGFKNARYFLIASIASMLGTVVTALSVWGFLSFSQLKFRAVEIGMLVDATLLALALANQLRSIQMQHLNAEERAARDPLTDLFNRRSFTDMAKSIWSTAKRSGRDLSAIMVDLDHFKSINDLHGHALGDAALVETARILSASARQGDIVARWGGEEFLLLLPETRLDDALALADRLKDAISSIRIPSGNGPVRLTASFGVAQKAGHDSLEELISEADALLYRSKKEGRNRISA